jgi:hypothetical protein
MNADQIHQLVASEIGDAWDTTNSHCVDLRKSVVRPQQTKVIERLVFNGKFNDRLIDAWIVLFEHPTERAGYRIIVSPDGSKFGLASEGFETDKHLVLCGWYGDFLSTFLSM